MWNPAEHSDDENLRWCWLRAVEWGAWPIFLSQPIAPLLFLFLPWWFVILVLTGLNTIWSLFIKHRLVVPALAYWGSWFVRLKWIVCPVACYLLWHAGTKAVALLALFWPLAVALMPRGTTQIGVIQKMFMHCLGYESKT
jgi:hypothetical protein